MLSPLNKPSVLLLLSLSTVAVATSNALPPLPCPAEPDAFEETHMAIQRRAVPSLGDTIAKVEGALSYLLCVLAADIYSAAGQGSTLCEDPNAISAISKSVLSKYSLPPPPSSTCAPQYTNIEYGAVYAAGVGMALANDRPTSFVTNSGKGLVVDNKPFRIVGPNIYWLGLNDNIPAGSGFSVGYPEKGQIREAFASAVAMGATTVRSHTLGVSTGTPLSIWPTASATNEAAFDSIDYSIFAARNYGIRLIIPLTDNYNYYHGGKLDFLKWSNLSVNNSAAFYTNPQVIGLYKSYISTVLNHVNTYTGVAYKNDPTIMAWETGNELGGYGLKDGPPTASWTADITAYIKSIALHHLVIDGSDGLTNSTGKLTSHALEVDTVDIVSNHLYPAAVWQLQSDAALMNGSTKSYLVGELDWTGLHGGDSLPAFYTALEAIPQSGSMIWSLLSHDANCCNYMTHNDGLYSMQYPNGNSTMMPKILSVVQHWHRMRGMIPPQALAAVSCPQPELIL